MIVFICRDLVQIRCTAYLDLMECQLVVTSLSRGHFGSSCVPPCSCLRRDCGFTCRDCFLESEIQELETVSANRFAAINPIRARYGNSESSPEARRITKPSLEIKPQLTSQCRYLFKGNTHPCANSASNPHRPH